MPILISLVARSLIQMAVTLGLISLAEAYVFPMINAGIAKLIQLFGVSEEDAKDIMANEILQFAESVGIGVLILRAKVPTKIAERLGFTSKGWNKRNLSAKAQKAVGTATNTTAAAAAGIPIPTAADALKIVTTAKSTSKGFAVYAGLFLGVLGVIQLAFMNFLNAVDFGNWNSGAYQKTFQKIYEKISFGLLVPDEDYRKSKTASADVFGKVYNTYQLEGVTAINDPYKLQSVPFTRNNLLDLIDRVGAELLLTKGAASTKDVLLISQTYMVFKIDKETEKSAAELAPRVAGTTRALAPSPTLFVGHIDKGQLSAVKTFTPQIRERIATPEELTDAVQDNVAAFLSALPGMIAVNIKLKDQVTAPDGSQLIGTLGQVQTSTSKTGKPRFRRFRNSFVVAEVSIIKNTGGKSVIGELVAGALDESMLDPTQEQLVALGNALSRKMITSDMREVRGIQFAAAPAALRVGAAETEKPPETVLPSGQTTAPPFASTPAKEPTTLTGLSVEETLAIQKAQKRKESTSAWEVIAADEGTQINVKLPDGSIVRAGINPKEAATLDTSEEFKIYEEQFTALTALRDKQTGQLYLTGTLLPKERLGSLEATSLSYDGAHYSRTGGTENAIGGLNELPKEIWNEALRQLKARGRVQNLQYKQ